MENHPLKTVLITGASSGFGRLSVDLFLAEGWRVVATLRRAKERSMAFSEPLKTGRLIILEGDVTNSQDRRSLAEWVKDHSANRLDALVNNAGYGLFGATEDLTEDQWRCQMEVNFFGTLLLTRELLPAIRQARGAVISVSSMLGLHTFPLTGGYCASKFAMEGWMESMSGELMPHGVSCYVVEPGGYPTEFGTSIAWAQSPAHSVYSKATESYQKLRVKVSERNRNKNPADVAALILKLALKRPKGLRHAVGSDAVSMMLLGRLMPRNLFSRLTGFVFHRLLQKAWL